MQPTIQLKRIDKDLPMPAYHTSGAAAIDLYARVAVTFKPQERLRVPLNVVIAMPEGYWAMLVPRSSLSKRGLMPATGIGVIDPDYCGEDDEYQASLFNATNAEVTIERGERIMQVLFLPLLQPLIEEVTQMNKPNRGGFGTTGV